MTGECFNYGEKEYTQAEVNFAICLGKYFSFRNSNDIMRVLSDLDVTNPFCAETYGRIAERLARYGYDSNETNNIVWALRQAVDSGRDMPKLAVCAVCGFPSEHKYHRVEAPRPEMLHAFLEKTEVSSGT